MISAQCSECQSEKNLIKRGETVAKQDHKMCLFDGCRRRGKGEVQEGDLEWRDLMKAMLLQPVCEQEGAVQCEEVLQQRWAERRGGGDLNRLDERNKPV